MSNVQVRDVPDAVLRALKQRAAAQGLSLQRFLQEVLLAEAAVVTNAALLDDAAAADTGGYRAEPGDAALELDRERRDRGE
jgi:plasmid stability protein